MLQMNLSSLVSSLEPSCRQALENAAAACVGRNGQEIGVEDFIETLLEVQHMRDILTQFSIIPDAVRELLRRGNAPASRQSRPVFSSLLIEFLQEAYLLNSLECRRESVDVFVLILALLKNPTRYGVMRFYQELSKIPADELHRLMEGLGEDGRGSLGSPASEGSGQTKETLLKKYTVDFIEEARSGKIDPIFARGPQIRQMVDILSRRRKNNPILVGDPGVGKTAVVEGLALKIHQNDVPKALSGTRVIGLDMGRLQAGASVKGEFEKRLKGIIDEIKASPVPTILFIDEAHTLVGSGNEAGGGDGANLLKPALARGELRTIAATTWSEYKKYFEKDAALARRFQLVKLDQPNLEETKTILRGIVPHYESMHKVYIRDDAVTATAELSTRYISGRMQPDKAIDVLDTACARVKVSLGAKPARLEELEEEKASLSREVEAMERDASRGVQGGGERKSGARHALLKGRLAEVECELDALMKRWADEKGMVEDIIALRTSEEVVGEASETPDHKSKPENSAIADKTQEGESAKTAGSSPDAASTAEESKTKESLADLRARLKTLQGNDPLVFYEVSPQLVASIVAEWTGIPLGKLTEDAAEKIASLGTRLRKRVKGQDYALEALEKAVLASRTGMNSPTAPTGIFLFVGPSGVGKTETALAMADEIFGGESMLISINMSEFQEKHTVSRLIGSPPGYVGYGEGGRLTEAVRRQPYSAVLFDEVEKAHPDVINLFYQMFDKGVLADGEGREIDFKNTMIFLTSNLAGDVVSALCEDEEPSPETLTEAIRPALTQFFKPALLGRMTVIPYVNINPSIMKELVVLKLERIAERLFSRHNIRLAWEDNVVDSIAGSCTAVETGARNIDHIINASLLPSISAQLLGALAEGRETEGNILTIGLNTDKGHFTYHMGCA